MTKLIKNKAYIATNSRRIFYFDGNNLFDYDGEVEKNIPHDLKRIPEFDEKSKYIILLGRDKLARKDGTFVSPKDKTIVRVLTSGGGSFYGIVKGEYIIGQNGCATTLFHTAYEKIRPTKEQRCALEAVYKNEEQKDKLLSKINLLKEELKELNNKNTVLNSDVSRSFGLVTKKEFDEIFEEHLPDWLRREMKEKDYRIRDYNYNVFNSTFSSITIEREYYIEKWHDSVMVYREYDDTAHLDTSSPEASKLAKKYINRYSKPLSVKAKVDSRLELGDKRWLTLCEEYTLRVKECTEAEAIRLAEEFAKR